MAQDLKPPAVAHSVAEIERTLAHVWFGARTPEGAAAAAAAEGEHHVAARSSVLNLVVVAGRRETAERCAAAIEATAGRHPSRSIILASLDSEGPPSLDATIQALSIPTPGGGSVTGAETIFITVYGQVASHLASIIVPLLLHDLPVALWWPGDPNFRSHRADRLLPIADRLIVDGSAWSGDGMDRLAALAQIAGGDRRLVAADFALLRQSRWREAVASVYDLPDLRPHLRAVRSISVEYAAGDDCDRSGLTNIVRPVYHVAWLASRLGMTVDEPMKRHPDCRRTVLLRQGTHQVLAEWKPVVSDLAPGSTVRVQITSQVRGAEMVGEVTAGDLTVDVAIHDKGRERVRRTYLAPRLKDVDLLERAVEDNAGDPVAGETLAMAGCLIDAEPPARKNVARRRSHDYE